MNARVRDSEVEVVEGIFGVLRMNPNRRKLIGLCTEKNLSVGNTLFGVDGRKSLLGFIVVREEERNKLLNVNVFRGAEGRIPDHHLVVTKLRCLRRWQE